MHGNQLNITSHGAFFHSWPNFGSRTSSQLSTQFLQLFKHICDIFQSIAHDVENLKTLFNTHTSRKLVGNRPTLTYKVVTCDCNCSCVFPIDHLSPVMATKCFSQHLITSLQQEQAHTHTHKRSGNHPKGFESEENARHSFTRFVINSCSDHRVDGLVNGAMLLAYWQQFLCCGVLFCVVWKLR